MRCIRNVEEYFVPSGGGNPLPHCQLDLRASSGQPSAEAQHHSMCVMAPKKTENALCFSARLDEGDPEEVRFELALRS
jgi:hypothetical protein